MEDYLRNYAQNIIIEMEKRKKRTKTKTKQQTHIAKLRARSFFNYNRGYDHVVLTGDYIITANAGVGANLTYNIDIPNIPAGGTIVTDYLPFFPIPATLTNDEYQYYKIDYISVTYRVQNNPSTAVLGGGTVMGAGSPALIITPYENFFPFLSEAVVHGGGFTHRSHNALKIDLQDTAGNASMSWRFPSSRLGGAKFRNIPAYADRIFMDVPLGEWGPLGLWRPTTAGDPPTTMSSGCLFLRPTNDINYANGLNRLLIGTLTVKVGVHLAIGKSTGSGPITV